MRRVINLNNDWAFIQQEAFLIPGMPLTDMTETAVTIKADIGMQRHLQLRNSHWAAEKYLWNFWQRDSRRLFM